MEEWRCVGSTLKRHGTQLKTEWDGMFMFFTHTTNLDDRAQVKRKRKLTGEDYESKSCQEPSAEMAESSQEFRSECHRMEWPRRQIRWFFSASRIFLCKSVHKGFLTKIIQAFSGRWSTYTPVQFVPCIVPCTRNGMINMHFSTILLLPGIKLNVHPHSITASILSSCIMGEAILPPRGYQ